jgi:hypothetical protein
MIEVALFSGIGLLGYILSTQYSSTSSKKSNETFVIGGGAQAAQAAPAAAAAAARPGVPTLSTTGPEIKFGENQKGHANMVPFFGAKVTQNMRTDATQSILDTFSGTGSDYFQKREVASMYDVVPGQGNPFGNANESDFYQSRQVAGMNMKNVSPIERTYVAPGINDGYTNLGSGGYQQFNEAQQYAKPRTTDEMRTANKPKLTYDKPVIPGSHFITEPGLQAPVNKNRPDTFNILTDEKTGELTHLNTAVGAQVAPAAFPQQLLKEQNRETTSIEYYGQVGSDVTLASYVRSFTEPFEQFMKLTVGEWFGVAGGEGAAAEGSYIVDPYLVAYTNPGRETTVDTGYTPGGNIAINSGEASAGAVKVNKDESMLNNVREFEAAGNVVPTAATQQQKGDFRYTQQLPNNADWERIDPAILDAFKANPYTQSLQSIY